MHELVADRRGIIVVRVGVRTLFPNQTVISVVGVVGVAEATMRVLELQKLVSMLARVASAEYG